ncbi:MAG: OmpH family outer membrane protein [Muribaculaceae bacterium]|nr:OmpH family outer membrane protein [Muribaculaceae bacterium]
MNNLKNLMKLAVLAMALTITMGACNQDNKKETKKQEKVDPAKPGQHVEIRYIDQDSVTKSYNLAKDFQEMETRLNNEMDQAQKKHEDQIQEFLKNATQRIQEKDKAGQVTQDQVEVIQLPNGASAPLLKADAQKYNQMMQAAQTELSKLQQNAANQMQLSQKQLTDSVDNFLKDFAKQNNYDVILYKAATLYINPSLDVTDKVIEGLNKRYTKVAKK